MTIWRQRWDSLCNSYTQSKVRVYGCSRLKPSIEKRVEVASADKGADPKSIRQEAGKWDAWFCFVEQLFLALSVFWHSQVKSVLWEDIDIWLVLMVPSNQIHRRHILAQCLGCWWICARSFSTAYLSVRRCRLVQGWIKQAGWPVSFFISITTNIILKKNLFCSTN